MPFSKEIIYEIKSYCENHLPSYEWYKNEFCFIKDIELQELIISEFKATRFAYKIYEGFEADNENLRFEVRNQINSYASIYEAVIEYVLNTYYSNTKEFDELMHEIRAIKISIPKDKQQKLEKYLTHDDKKIVPVYYKKKKREKTKIRFSEKCRTAEKLGLIYEISDKRIDLPSELIEFYSYRNAIHIVAEQRKGIEYELALSKRAYRRLKPFVSQIKEKLINDHKL